MLIIKPAHLTVIKEEAVNNYPLECCGLLVGKREGEKRIIEEVIPTINDWENQRQNFTEIMDKTDLGSRENFSIAPQIILQIQKKARENNLDIIGIYHSHPDHSCHPSAFDEALAWVDYSYIIVSVVGGAVHNWQSWRLNSHGKLIPENTLDN